MLNQEYLFEYKTNIKSVLFESTDNSKVHTYAILSPLKNDEISGALLQFENNAVPLLSMDEDEDLRDKGPQLIRVEPKSNMAKWLTNVHGKRWVIYIQSRLETKELQAFLSPLCTLVHPEGEEYYFHFYDNVTLQYWLPAKEDSHLFFKGIDSIIYEGDAPWSLMRYQMNKQNEIPEESYKLLHESLDLRNKKQQFSKLTLGLIDDNPSMETMFVFTDSEFEALQKVQSHNFKLELRDALWKTHPYAQKLGIEKTQNLVFENIDLFVSTGIKQRNLLQAVLIAIFDQPQAWDKYKSQLINRIASKQQNESQRTQAFCKELEKLQNDLENIKV